MAKPAVNGIINSLSLLQTSLRTGVMTSQVMFGTTSSVNFNPIGFIESCYKQKFGTPRQSGLVPEARSVLRIDPSFQPEISLEGLMAFSHVWVIFVFHALKDYSFHGKVHPPRLEGKSIGLFATRSPHRPNPIGLSLVRLGQITGNEIELWGGDFVEGTPVLDIKPYLKEVESKPEATSGWAEGKTQILLEASISYSESATTQMSSIKMDFPNPKGHPALFKKVLEETISLDPRPQLYKGLNREHIMRLWDWDVFFTVEESNVFIHKILKIN
ncbi:MAG: tRNA (N6-threonylcarbamoyladenosine(37)-N6)-methyltransferase TrmO [Bdellovibrionota bacterium]